MADGRNPAHESPLYWRQPSYLGRLSEASGAAKIRGRCGDTMEMYLRIEGERLLEARFFTDAAGLPRLSRACRGEPPAEGNPLPQPRAV